MSDDAPALELIGVEKSFGGEPVCAGISLRVEKGEFFTFLGPSGCGKTTLLRLIAGFISPDAGEIRLDGQDAARIPVEKRGVGMVFQNYALFPHMTVFQNIEYGLAIQKKTPTQIRTSVARLMDMIGLAGFGERRVDELSGGEQQRVALARSLAVEPRLLLLDEPLSNLDARLRDKMREELKSLQKQLGVTTILVTHDQTEALTLSDRLAVFHKGGVAQTGSPRDVYDHPANAFVAGFVGETNLFRAEIADGAARLPGGLILRLGDAAARGEYVSIRPQSVELSAAPKDGPDWRAAEFIEARVQGVFVSYAVRIEGTVFQAAALNEPGGRIDASPGASPGATVFARLSPDAIRVLPR